MICEGKKKSLSKNGFTERGTETKRKEKRERNG